MNKYAVVLSDGTEVSFYSMFSLNSELTEMNNTTNDFIMLGEHLIRKCSIDRIELRKEEEDGTDQD